MPNIYLRQGQASPNDVKLVDPTASPVANVTGTGAVTGHVLVASATGIETFVASVAPSSAPALATGTGIEKFVGSGSPVSHVLVAAGSGAEKFVAVGAVNTLVLSASALGIEKFLGSGAVSSHVLTTSSSGLQKFVGSGATILPIASISGIGAQYFVGLGTVSTQKLQAAGVGNVISSSFTGIGDVTAPRLVAAGVGSLTLPVFVPGLPIGIFPDKGIIWKPQLGLDALSTQILVDGNGASTVSSFSASGRGNTSQQPIVPTLKIAQRTRLVFKIVPEFTGYGNAPIREMHVQSSGIVDSTFLEDEEMMMGL